MGNCRSASAAADDVHVEQLEGYSAVQSFDTRNSDNAEKTENAGAARTYSTTEILSDLQQLPSAPTAETSIDTHHNGSLFEATFTAQCVDDFIDSKATISDDSEQEKEEEESEEERGPTNGERSFIQFDPHRVSIETSKGTTDDMGVSCVIAAAEENQIKMERNVATNDEVEERTKEEEKETNVMHENASGATIPAVTDKHREEKEPLGMSLDDIKALSASATSLLHQTSTHITSSIPLVSTQAELLVSTLPSIQEPGGSRVVSVEENPSKALVVVEKSPANAYSLVDIENIDIETTIVSVPVEEDAGNKISAYALDEEEITKALVTVLVEENAKNIASAYAGSLLAFEEETRSSSAIGTVEESADHMVALEEETSSALTIVEESADHYYGLGNMEMKNALVVAENSTGEKVSAYALEKDDEAVCSALVGAENSTGVKVSAYALEKDNEDGCTSSVSTKENCGNNTFVFVSEQEKAESMNQSASVSVAYKQKACQWAIDEASVPEKKRCPKPEDILIKRKITENSRRRTSASGHYRGNGKHGSGDPLNFMANW